MVRIIGAILFFALIYNDCNLMQLFSSIGTTLPHLLLQGILLLSLLVMFTLLAFSLFIWIEQSRNPNSATGYFLYGLSNVLFPSFVMFSVLFHTLTYILLLLKVYKVIKSQKTKEVELKMKVARNRLCMFLGLVVVTIPVFGYAEAITYQDPMKEFLLAISFDLLGLNALAMVYLFQAMGLLLKSDKRIQNRKAPPLQCIEMTITRHQFDGPLVSATQLS
jgi:hypothetical protein